jgi:vacuolar-type H+-ATPase subunit C/Vma6
MFNAGLRGYSAARGLVGALRARAPYPDLVEELLAMSDAQACASHLGALPFVHGIEGADGPAGAEHTLRTACAVFGQRITRFLTGPASEFLSTYLLRYGVYNVKVLFRAALSGVKEEGREALYPIRHLYVSPRERLTLDAPEKVVAFTEGTRLEKPVQVAYEMYKASGDLFIFELSLDREYALMLWEASQATSLTEGRRLRQRVILPYLGINAIVWALWLKTHHAMSAEQIVNVLPVPSRIIRVDTFVLLVQAGNFAEVARAAKVGQLARFLARHEMPGDVSSWHRLSRRFIWSLINARDLSAVFDIATLTSTLMKWEFIVDDAITVTAGKAAGLGHDEIVPLLATKAA